ncbi:MAG: vWA domain-containing protein [Anaerolineales bacterium]
MTFLWPAMLWLLITLPLMVAWYLALQQRRRRLATAYGSLGFGPLPAQRNIGARRHIPPLLSLLALAFLLFALARPQAVVSLPRQEGTLILAFDVSGSMAADDLQPTRMEAAKAAARDFVERQPDTVQIGVVAFSDSGFSVQTPTNDQADILAAIDRLAPERGTSLARGIRVSLEVIAAAEPTPEPNPESYTTRPPTPEPARKYPSAAIVLLSDGENTVPPDPLPAAQSAAESEVRIYTVGIGSALGATLQVEGFTVHTQLDEDALQQIAALTNAEYFNAESQDDLTAIYANLTPQLALKSESMEITSILAGVGLAMLLVGGALSLLWFSRWP